MSSRKGVMIDFPQTAAALPGGESVVEREIAKSIRQRRTLDMARSFGVAGDPAQPAPPAPPPGSYTEAMDGMAKAAEIHKGVAEMGLAIADREREGRQDAEADAAGAFQAGAKQRDDLWDRIFAMQDKQFERMETLREKAHTSELEKLQAQQTEILKRIEAGQTAALAAKDQQLAQRDGEIAMLKTQVQTLSQRQTVEQALAEALTSDDPRSHPLVKRVTGLFGQRTGKTMEEIEAGFAEDQANLHIDRERAAMDAEAEERAAKAARAKKGEKLLDAAIDVVTQAKTYLPRAIPALAGAKPPVEEPAGWSPPEETPA